MTRLDIPCPQPVANEDQRALLRRVAVGHATVEDACTLARLLPRWVPLDERKPPAWTDVLVVVLSDDGDPLPVVDLASYRPGRGWFYTDRGDLRITPDPLYWMPLPEPPADIPTTLD